MRKLLLAFISMLVPFIMAAQCTTNNSNSCACKDGSTNCDLLPDIIVGRPPLLVNGTNGYIEYPQVCPSGCSGNDGRLRISVTSPNVGFGPLEVRAINTIICGTDTFVNPASGFVCPNGNPLKQLVNQRVYHKNGATMTYYDRAAGSMTYHPSHGHMHVDDWGIYTLRTATSNPDPLTWPIIGTGSKLAFCLMDYGSCSTYNGHCVDSLNNVLINGNFPNYGLGGGAYGCSPTIQGISSGYTDIYYQSLDGMWITLPAGLCNGQYWVVVQLDPKGYFLESNENNNVIAVPITLTQQNGVVPTVTASGVTTFCQGGSVTLTSSAATNYLWSNGATTQSIVVTQSGSYSVTVNTTAVCSTTSAPKIVTVNPLVVTASGTPSSICSGESVLLSASATSTGSITQSINFTNNTLYTIPDNNPTGISSVIAVSGLSPTTLLTNSIVSVKINITHTYDADLIISLISPSGNTINLSNSRGGSADNFVNTIFSASATTSISAGTAPFTGTYLPEAAFSSLTGNLNGSWTLKVVDHAGNNQGTINNWTLTLNQSLPTTLSYAWTSNPIGYSSTATSGTVNPTVPTSYTVTVTESSTGCTGSQTIPVAVTSLLHVTTNTPNAICAGISTTLIANSATNCTWSPSAGLSSISGTSVVASPSQTTTYKVVGTNGACKDSTNVTVIVNQLPPVAVNTSTAICAGSSLTLNSIGAQTYSWTPSLGLNTDIGSIVIANPALTTTYFVTGTDFNGCSATANTTVTVNSIPAVILNTNSISVCNGQSTILTASGANSYLWSPILGLDVSTSSTVNATVTSDITYTVTGKSNNCSSTATVVLTVNNIPATPPAINTTATNFCAPFTAIYSIAAVPNTVDYTWTVPAGLNIDAGQGTTSITVSGTVSATGDLCVTANNICGSSAPVCMALNITAGLPGTIAAINSNTAKACPNDIITYSVAPIANATSYTWTAPTGSTITSGQGTTSIVVTFNSNFIATANLNVRASNACGLGPYKVKPISLNIPSTPGTISGTSSGICLNTFNYSVAAVNGINYLWAVPANTTIVSGQSTNSVTIQYLAGFVSGNISVIAQNGCGSSAARTKSVTAAPLKPTTVNGPLSVCTGQSGVTYSTPLLTGATSYLWTVTGGTITSGQGTNTITITFASNPRNAYVKVGGVNSCASSLTKSITIPINSCTKVNNFDSNSAALNLYPNPTKDFVEVIYNTNLSAQGDITINNILGQVKYTQIINTEEGKNSYMIDLRKLPSGVYIVNVRQDGRNYTQRLIVK